MIPGKKRGVKDYEKWHCKAHQSIVDKVVSSKSCGWSIFLNLKSRKTFPKVDKLILTLIYLIGVEDRINVGVGKMKKNENHKIINTYFFF